MILGIVGNGLITHQSMDKKCPSDPEGGYTLMPLPCPISFLLFYKVKLIDFNELMYRQIDV